VTEPTLGAIAQHLDTLFAVSSTSDYPLALNGVQVGHRGPVHRIAVAVDASARTIALAAAEGANLLVVHHGLFWSGLRPVTCVLESRLRALFAADMALYSVHLPLDAHVDFGNSALLARALDLRISAPFARFQDIHCGVRGDADLDTAQLADRVRAWALALGHHTVVSPLPAGHRTSRWAICSGSGAQAETLAEAYAVGVDTLIVGEGPHWSAVEAEEHGLVIIYAGHYATETLGVRALAEHLTSTFGVPSSFVHAPTGL
jgi:dinuclear metal center YbgI/SA1388 family protein